MSTASAGAIPGAASPAGFSWLRQGLLLGLLILLLVLGGCTKMANLQVGLTDNDANEMVLVLTRIGIAVEKQKNKEGVTLVVKEEEISRATEAMNAAGLPRRNLSNLGEVFKKQGMISSPMEERIRYIHGLSEELESTLRQFDNVISARVHVVLPERIAPGEPIQPSSAAVFVKYRAPMDEDVVTPRIRRLVASSIPGLANDEGRSKVSVVMMLGEEAPAAIQWSSVGPFMVAMHSAGPLMWTLLALGALSLVGPAMGLFLLAKRNPRFAALLEQRAKVKKARKAKKARLLIEQAKAAAGAEAA
ncbi:MAG: type III secretion system inner membrane ring lipoprotein SctJ [Janthinobacterium lividum]